MFAVTCLFVPTLFGVCSFACLLFSCICCSLRTFVGFCGCFNLVFCLLLIVVVDCLCLLCFGSGFPWLGRGVLFI